MTDYYHDETEDWGCAAASWGFGMVILMFLGQIGWYLYSGEWYSMSLITPLIWMEAAWATHPESWLGLHEVLTVIPL